MMDKRNFIKTSITGAVALAAIPSMANSIGSKKRMHLEIVPKVSELTSISGFQSESGFIEHHTEYLQKPSAYLKKKYSGLGAKKILLNHKKFTSEEVEMASEYLNHRIYFRSLFSTMHRNNSNLNKLVSEQFGSNENLNRKLIEHADNMDADGWVWLNYKNGKLKVESLNGNNNPLAQTNQAFPLLCIDLHGHAYNTSFKNNKAKYTGEFLNHVNWSFVDKRLQKAIKFYS